MYGQPHTHYQKIPFLFSSCLPGPENTKSVLTSCAEHSSSIFARMDSFLLSSGSSVTCQSMLPATNSQNNIQQIDFRCVLNLLQTLRIFLNTIFTPNCQKNPAALSILASFYPMSESAFPFIFNPFLHPPGFLSTSFHAIHNSSTEPFLL